MKRESIKRGHEKFAVCCWALSFIGPYLGFRRTRSTIVLYYYSCPNAQAKWMAAKAERPATVHHSIPFSFMAPFDFCLFWCCRPTVAHGHQANKATTSRSGQAEKKMFYEKCISFAWRSKNAWSPFVVRDQKTAINPFSQLLSAIFQRDRIWILSFEKTSFKCVKLSGHEEQSLSWLFLHVSNFPPSLLLRREF